LVELKTGLVLLIAVGKKYYTNYFVPDGT